MSEERNPYYISYCSLPLTQLRMMWCMRGIVDGAVVSGEHRRSEADLRIEAMKMALDKAERDAEAKRNKREAEEAWEARGMGRRWARKNSY